MSLFEKLLMGSCTEGLRNYVATLRRTEMFVIAVKEMQQGAPQEIKGK